MEEMETEPITQEPGVDESNTNWSILDHIRKEMEMSIQQQDDIRRKVQERIREQQQLQDDIWRKGLERLKKQLQQDYLREEGERMSRLDLQMLEGVRRDLQKDVNSLGRPQQVERQERRLVDQSQLISPSSQWEKYICPDCDNLMDDPIQTSCGHQMCYGCFDQRRRSWWPLCPVRGDDGWIHKMSQNDWQRNNIANDRINKLMVRCDDCGPMSVKDYREQGHSSKGSLRCKVYETKLERRQVDQSQLIRPSSQWEKYICPDCDNLMDDPIQTSCGHQMCYGCFDQRRRRSWWSLCPVEGDDGWTHEMSQNDWQRNNIANDQINKLMVRCDDCGPMSVKDYREQEHSIEGTSKICQMNKQKLSDFYKSFANYIGEKDLDYLKKLLLKDRVIQRPFLSAENVFAECLQTQQYQGLEKFLNCLLRSDHTGRSYEDFVLKLQKITKEGCRNIASYVLEVGHKDCLEMAAKWHGAVTELKKLSSDEQQQVLTQVLKETLPAAKRHLSIDEIRPLLYQNGVITSDEANDLLGIFTGEEKITRLYTEMLPKKGMIGLKKFMKILVDTGQELPKHLLHLGVLANVLSVKLSRIKSIHQHEIEDTAKKDIVSMVYSESLPDAVINLSRSVNKLLLPMLKKQVITNSEYYWLTEQMYPQEKIAILYKVILPQKGMKVLQDYMELLQDTGKNIPRHQKHVNLMKSKLQFFLF